MSERAVRRVEAGTGEPAVVLEAGIGNGAADCTAGYAAGRG